MPICDVSATTMSTDFILVRWFDGLNSKSYSFQSVEPLDELGGFDLDAFSNKWGRPACFVCDLLRGDSGLMLVADFLS